MIEENKRDNPVLCSLSTYRTPPSYFFLENKEGDVVFSFSCFCRGGGCYLPAGPYPRLFSIPAEHTVCGSYPAGTIPNPLGHI